MVGRLRQMSSPCMTRTIASTATGAHRHSWACCVRCWPPPRTGRAAQVSCLTAVAGPGSIHQATPHEQSQGLTTKLGPHRIGVSGHNSWCRPTLVSLICPLIAWNTVDIHSSLSPVHLPLRTRPNADIAPHAAKQQPPSCINILSSHVNPRPAHCALKSPIAGTHRHHGLVADVFGPRGIGHC